MKTINLKTARSFVVATQLPEPLKGKSGTLQAIEHLGYIQIDTISVIQRAHHHVLWTRVPDYQPEFLQQLTAERKIHDYWAHAASFLPMRDYRFSLIRKKEVEKSDGHWFKKDPKLMRFVLQQFKKRGALMSRDFEKSDFQSNHAWNRHPINQAIMNLYMSGKLMITGRKKFQKIYDLPERIIANNVNTKMPTQQEYFEYLIERDIRAHGLIKAREIGYLLKIDRKTLKNILQKKVKSGEVEEIKIEGVDGTYFVFTGSLEKISPTKKKVFYLLSPFDNLVIQRKRLSEIFNYEYQIECYVPEAKRKVGYFALPMLFGNEFVGKIDLKADRKTKILWVKNLVWENNVKKTKTMLTAFNKKLQSFMKFNGCESIQVEEKLSTKDIF